MPCGSSSTARRGWSCRGSGPEAPSRAGSHPPDRGSDPVRDGSAVPLNHWHRLLSGADALYVRLAERWHDALTTRRLGSILILSYLATLVVVEVNRQGWAGAWGATWLPTNHFAAVGVAFTLLLVVEVIGIVFALAESVANSLGKQFELLALILLRKAFLTFAEFGEPIEFDRVRQGLLEMGADAGGALAIFAVVGLFYRVQLHRKITRSEDDQAAFIRGKRLVALLILVTFGGLAVADGWAWIQGDAWPFFETFYLVLIFSDILIVLISFRYTSNFTVLFRNSGFALSTVGARLALSAPAFLNVLIGIGAAAFALLVSLAYNTFRPYIPESEADEPAEVLATPEE